ncbi:MAG TPA: amidohydrolase family protein [Candidatus Binatia bacterium]|nr:amidohydrolase family protein [Candidatus Binatia bacterium]
MTFDLILHDATIFDGTGAPPVSGSIGVLGDRIAAVGDLGDAAAAWAIDCAGKAIAPGFIDMHSHSDWVIPHADHGAVLAPLLEQGITTIVGGNCGCSPAPYVAGNRKLLPLVGRMLHDHDLDYRWSSMGEFLAALEQQGLALNLAQLVGHGTIRAAVNGIKPGPANAEEIGAMADLARAALDEGALGLSTGLGYAPGVFADTDELVGTTAPLKERRGVYTSHARSYIALGSLDDPTQQPSNLRAVDETAAVFRAHGIPVQHSHLIFVGDTTWPTTDLVLEHLDRLVEEGVDIAWDAFPYVGGNTTLVVFMPPWTLPNLRDAVTNPEQRQRAAGTLNWVLPHLGMRWEDTQIMWVPDRRVAHYEGMTIAEIARDRGNDPTETYLDLVGELGSQARIINWNYSGRDDEETSLRKVLQHSRTCVETDTILTGNGFDNPASYGTFPRVLGRYVRELKLITLANAVRRMTGFSADRMGLRDRGRIATGLAADLVVFDPETVGDTTTRRAPNRSPSGIETVVLNGHVVVRDGKFDRAARAGQVLRRR